jgi:hypothetical protein
MHKADNLTAICEQIVYRMWEPPRLTTLWASTACYRDNFKRYIAYDFTNKAYNLQACTFCLLIF